MGIVLAPLGGWVTSGAEEAASERAPGSAIASERLVGDLYLAYRDRVGSSLVPYVF
jgi:hypothetical protein